MQIKSKIFGEIEIEDSKIITLPKGLMGFEEYTKFAVAFDSEKESKNGIMWLQSVEEENLAFPVMDPTHIMKDYNPIVEDEWLEPIGEFNSDEELYVLCVLTVPSDLKQMTINLKAPVVINTSTMKGCQIIVNNEDYLVRFNVYDYIEDMAKEGSQC